MAASAARAGPTVKDRRYVLIKFVYQSDQRDERRGKGWRPSAFEFALECMTIVFVVFSY